MAERNLDRGWRTRFAGTNAINHKPIYVVKLGEKEQFRTEPTRTVGIAEILGALRKELPYGVVRKHYVKKVREAICPVPAIE